jgi:hypothetical protein
VRNNKRERERRKSIERGGGKEVEREKKEKER